MNTNANKGVCRHLYLLIFRTDINVARRQTYPQRRNIIPDIRMFAKNISLYVTLEGHVVLISVPIVGRCAAFGNVVTIIT